MKSIAIFQLTNGGGSRLVDGLYTSIEKGIAAYDKYPGAGITFLWNCINNVPFSIQDGKDITDADVEAMYAREKEWASTEDLIRIAQERLDSGHGGIYNGIRLVKIDTDEYRSYRFLIEIRHLHE